MSCGLGLPRKTKRWAQEWVSTATGGCRLSVESGLSTVNAGVEQMTTTLKNPPWNTSTPFKTVSGDVARVMGPAGPGGEFFLRISGQTKRTGHHADVFPAELRRGRICYRCQYHYYSAAEATSSRPPLWRLSKRLLWSDVTSWGECRRGKLRLSPFTSTAPLPFPLKHL